MPGAVVLAGKPHWNATASSTMARRVLIGQADLGENPYAHLSMLT
jgi:hypothetical protein